MVVRKPLGVTAAITPWNYPVATLVAKIGPAFVTGNTVVAKPSPFTPLSSLALGAVFRAVVPRGTLNVLGGSDEVGAWMTAHPQVRKISFTGSVPTGKKIMRAAADDLKRVTLELGGNDPAIVLPDVDAAQVAPRLFWGALPLGLGDPRSRPRRGRRQQLERGMDRLRLRRGSLPRWSAPPQPSDRRDPLTYDDARRAGGTIEAGGAPLARPGYFYPPTLVTGIGEGVRLVDEEQFGTALPIIPYSDVEDALAQANRSHYGLGGSVWTADIARGEEIAQRLECGTAWVNQHIETGAFAPFGGMKWSGIGRENGRWGIEEFCDLQVVSTRLA